MALLGQLLVDNWNWDVLELLDGASLHARLRGDSRRGQLLDDRKNWKAHETQGLAVEIENVLVDVLLLPMDLQQPIRGVRRPEPVSPQRFLDVADVQAHGRDDRACRIRAAVQFVEVHVLRARGRLGRIHVTPACKDALPVESISTSPLLSWSFHPQPPYFSWSRSTDVVSRLARGPVESSETRSFVTAAPWPATVLSS